MSSSTNMSASRLLRTEIIVVLFNNAHAILIMPWTEMFALAAWPSSGINNISSILSLPKYFSSILDPLILRSFSSYLFSSRVSCHGLPQCRRCHALYLSDFCLANDFSACRDSISWIIPYLTDIIVWVCSERVSIVFLYHRTQSSWLSWSWVYGRVPTDSTTSSSHVQITRSTTEGTLDFMGRVINVLNIVKFQDRRRISFNFSMFVKSQCFSRKYLNWLRWYSWIHHFNIPDETTYPFDRLHDSLSVRSRHKSDIMKFTNVFSTFICVWETGRWVVHVVLFSFFLSSISSSYVQSIEKVNVSHIAAVSHTSPPSSWYILTCSSHVQYDRSCAPYYGTRHRHRDHREVPRTSSLQLPPVVFLNINPRWQ